MRSIRRTLLAARHRDVGLTDLLVAAVAEQHRITVLHYDSDYDVISEFIDLQARWVAPRGNLD